MKGWSAARVPALPAGRRDVLRLLSMAVLTFAQPSFAMRRARYGGTVRFALPLPVTRLDPHDGGDLTASLLGPAVFESLFAINHGRPYPALTADLPTKKQEVLRFRLREGLQFASGKPLLGADVAYSLKRSLQLSGIPSLLTSPRTVRKDPLLVELDSPLGPLELAALLADPMSAIVPRSFSPESPDGCGAFAAQLSGRTLKLRHNHRAARGGSLLDHIEIEQTSVSQSLRAFEATHSALSLLGPGLHQPRGDARSISLRPLGYIALVPHPTWNGITRPGELHTLLSYLPDAPFSGLGVTRTRLPSAKWGRGPFSILVDKDNPFFFSLAEEIKLAWARRPADISIRALPPSEYAEAVRKGAFDTRMVWVSGSPDNESAVTQRLFGLDGKKPPRGGRLPPPEEAARQLRLGLLGQLTPRAAAAPELASLVQKGQLSLEQATMRDTRHER